MAVSEQCAICGTALAEPYASYPRAVCPACDARALNVHGRPARHIIQSVPAEEAGQYAFTDDGDNPVFIDGIRCTRRYKFGGWVSMRDER